MANINTSGLSDAIKTMYEKRLLIRAIPRLVHGRWVERGTLNKYGSVEWRKYGSMDAVTSALTEGATPDEQAMPSLSKITSTPSWYGAWIGYTDKLDMVNFDPVVSEVSGILGEQAALSADTLIRNALHSGATKLYSGGESARASLTSIEDDISYTDIIKAIATIEAASARPMSGDRFVVIIHPHTWATLMQDEVFVNMFVQEAPSSPIRTGYVGTLLRCEFYVTSNALEYADGGEDGADDIYTALFLGAQSHGSVGMAGLDPRTVDGGGPTGGPLTGQKLSPVSIIMKELGSAGAVDPLNQRGTIAWKMAFDIQILNSDWIYSLEHTNAFSAS